MLDLELLKTLVCVVDERSFSRAADRVHRTQSTVSQQIQKLEDRLGQALLVRDRTGKRVVPTEGGERLAHYARRLLAMAQEAEDALARPASLPPVRVGVPEDFDAVRMSTILSGFMASHPDVRLETVSGMSSDLRRRLDSARSISRSSSASPGPASASPLGRSAWCGSQARKACGGNRAVCLWRFSQRAASIGNAPFDRSRSQAGHGEWRSAARASPESRPPCLAVSA